MSITGNRFDVVIVGGGPAGLSAALILGRCCRNVLLCDRGTSRSWASKAMHGFVSRDGIAPAEFASLARKELQRYTTVAFEHAEVAQAAPDQEGFVVVVGTRSVRTRKLLIATGVEDELPPIEGFLTLFGTSVFQCPYCDGWEYRDQALAVYGRHERGFEMARGLTAWSRDIVLCTDGPAGFEEDQKRKLAANGIQLIEKSILRLDIEHGRLRHIVFSDGACIARDAVFFDTPSRGQSSLAAKLGCMFNADGGIVCDKHEATNVPGVYVAGNIIRNVQLSIVAAAEGATAAFGINQALTREDFDRRAAGASLDH